MRRAQVRLILAICQVEPAKGGFDKLNLTAGFGNLIICLLPYKTDSAYCLSFLAYSVVYARQ